VAQKFPHVPFEPSALVPGTCCSGEVVEAMNGHQGSDQAGQNAQESHLAYLLNSAGGQGALMGYGGLGGQRMGFGVGDGSLEEQILQRASALRAEALMQQHQQQAHQRQHLGAALAALQQQQQLSSLAGLNPAHLAALSAQEQEALLGRAAALRELGIAGGPGAALSGVGMDRLQQLELGRLEELERRRQQLAALAGFSVASGVRPNEVTSAPEQMNQDSVRGDSARAVEKKPATTAAEKNKEDLRKTPGTVIVPCRARGMPMDHNFKTAYFVISEDAKHGEDLVCSYFACRNGGVKFRYCAHCMAPVAKRNFCRRHDHGMSDKLPPPDSDESSVDENKARKQGGNKGATPKKGDKAPPAPVPTSSLDVLSKAASSSMPSKTKDSDAESQAKRKMETEEDEDDEAELAHISKKRRKMWSALLVKRPRTKDPRHLSSWLNEVLTVSDFETPFEQNGEATEAKAPTGDTPKKLKAGKEPEVGSPKKDKKSNGEKKKRKSDKMIGGESVESKPKKEKSESKAKEKKPKAPVKSNEAAKPKETKPSKAEVANQEKGSGASKPEGVVPKEKAPQKDTPKLEPKKVDDGAKSSVGKDVEKEKPSTAKSTPEVEEPKDSEKPSEAQSPTKKNATESLGEKEEEEDDDGFAGSFADWRDRKKDKLMKKGPGSLKK